MPEENTSDSVKEQSKKQSQNTQAVNSPLLPDNPDTPHTKTVSAQDMQSEVKILEDRVKRAEKWMIGLTAAITLLALCQVIAAFLQWWTMGGQLAEMKSGGTDTHTLAEAAKAQSQQAEAQTKKMAESLKKTDDLIRQATEQAKATNRLAVSSEATVKVARDNLRLAGNSLQVQQRPWVGILAIDGSFNNGVMKATATFKNYGKSPAFRATYHTAWGDKQPIVLLTYPWKETDSKSVMMPDEALIGGESTIEPTFVGLARIEQGFGRVYFFGEITYEDMFSYESLNPIIHLTHFCGFWEPKSKKFMNCTSYNDAD